MASDDSEEDKAKAKPKRKTSVDDDEKVVTKNLKNVSISNKKKQQDSSEGKLRGYIPAFNEIMCSDLSDLFAGTCRLWQFIHWSTDVFSSVQIVTQLCIMQTKAKNIIKTTFLTLTDLGPQVNNKISIQF